MSVPPVLAEDIYIYIYLYIYFFLGGSVLYAEASELMGAQCSRRDVSQRTR